jgi:hypothetical protein
MEPKNMPVPYHGKHLVMSAIGCMCVMIFGGCANQNQDSTSTKLWRQESWERSPSSGLADKSPDGGQDYPDWAKAVSLPLAGWAGQSAGYSTGVR